MPMATNSATRPDRPGAGRCATGGGEQQEQDQSAAASTRLALAAFARSGEGDQSFRPGPSCCRNYADDDLSLRAVAGRRELGAAAG
jgi:hypothetical protein